MPFKVKVIEIARRLGINPDYLMAAMDFESAGTFSPSVVNKQSGAVGLIQFTGPAEKRLGVTKKELTAMSAIQQLNEVEKYFSPYKGKLNDIDDVYMVILWPRAVGQPDTYVLFSKDDPEHPQYYTQNGGLDLNHDGKVTKHEAAKPVRKRLAKGRLPQNSG